MAAGWGGPRGYVVPEELHYMMVIYFISKFQSVEVTEIELTDCLMPNRCNPFLKYIL